MKKILFITAFTPSIVSAAEKNTMILLEDFGREYEVDLVFFAYQDDVKYEPVSKNVRVVKKCVINKYDKLLSAVLYPTVYPLFTVRFNIFRMLSIKSLVNKNKYDFIVFDHSQTFLYGKYLSKELPKFFISHDVIYQRISRISGKFVSEFCRLSEKNILNTPNVHHLTFSDKDCQLLNDLYGVKAKRVYDYIDPHIKQSQPTKIMQDEFAMMSSWKRSDNRDGLIWFVEKVVPLIKKETKIHIIGSNVPEGLDFEVNPLVKIERHGFVDNPYPLISNCQAFISPIFTGAGIKVKVIEALACGVPVIGTEMSFEGFDSQFKEFMLEFNAPEECIELMRKEISLERRQKVKQEFTNSFELYTIPQVVKSILA